MLCYGLSLTIAYGILLNQTACLISIAVSCVGAMIVWVWYGKEVKRLSEDMQK